MSLRGIVHAAIFAFLLIAIGGLWSTFDKQGGFSRFVLIGLSAAAYLLILHEGEQARRVATKALVIVGLLASFGLILSSVIIPTLGSLGGGLPGPILEVSGWFEAKFPAGLLVIVLPFFVSEWRIASRYRDVSLTRFWLAAILLAMTSIVASGSLASILTLMLGSLAIAVWRLSSGLALRLGWSRGWALTFLGSMVSSCAVLLLMTGSRIVNSDIGSAFVAGRIEIVQQSARLASDFLMTGGGLGSVPGLYAHYILGLPVFYVPHSHNLYLNLLIELGLPGLLAFLGIYSASAYLLLRSLPRARLESSLSGYMSAACLAALVLMLVQGLYDDPFYASWALPLLLVFPGMAVSQAQDYRVAQSSVPMSTLALVVMVPVLLTGVHWRTVQATWYANLGAVEMAKLELRGWPSGKWPDARLAPLMQGAELRFRQALTFQPENRTALHRLGMIAMAREDHSSAAALLGRAHDLDPEHRGVTKALGYSLVWTGEYERAARLLSEIPEAGRELKIYEGTWSSHGRDDLSQHSRNMLTLLADRE